MSGVDMCEKKKRVLQAMKKILKYLYVCVFHV